LNKEKHWWPQAESMVGFFNAYEQTNDVHYLNYSVSSWNYIKNNLDDERLVAVVVEGSGRKEYLDPKSVVLNDVDLNGIHLPNETMQRNSAGGDTKSGLNILATGIPQSYYLDTITPNRIFLLRNAFNDFNYITLVSTTPADIRVIIEDLIS
jgi:hypothetical protein